MQYTYADVKAGDPGGSAEDAYETMRLITEPVSRGEYRVTLLTIEAETPEGTAGRIQDGVQAAIDGSLVRPYIMNSLLTGGIDVNHPKTVARLNALASVEAGELLDQIDVDAVLDMGTGTKLKWPGILPGIIKNARQANHGRPE